MEQDLNLSGEANALARVVSLDAGLAWLEPIQTGSCGSCASAALCGSKGIGSLSNRLEARRFAVKDVVGLRVGDTVEVAFGGQNLIKAAAIAYVIPLLSALVVAALVQAQLGSDGWTMLGALGGMAAGFGLMKLLARRLEASGALNARIVRRNRHPIHFSHPGAPCDA
jgi:sigma-E factor negative regulatory protein RseC